MKMVVLGSQHAVGPRPDAPRGVWRLLRGGLLLVVAWAFVAVSLTLSSLFALVTLRIGVDRYRHVVARFLGRGVLRIGGIKLRVKGGERLAGRRMRIVAMNHTSQIDLFAIASILPPGGTAIAKKEIYRIPFLGWAFFALDIPSIDRAAVDKAKVSFGRAAERLRRQDATVFIAPEGTRSRDGGLGPFKMGLFHLAAESGAPIVPAVVRGAWECQPRGTFIPSPGWVEIEFLAEIDTGDFRGADLHQKRDELRAIYVDALEKVAVPTTISCILSSGTTPARDRLGVPEARSLQKA